MSRGTTIAVVVALFLALCGGVVATSYWFRASQSKAAQADIDRHGQGHDDHGEGNHHEQDDDHHGQAAEGGNHEDHEHAAQPEHDDEGMGQLNEKERKELGIELATAGPGKLAVQIDLPGEIVLNEDRVAHIVPRAPGIVREVLKNVGDGVRVGEVMAWLESAELGQAKVDYLATWAELGCCTIDLTRAQEVHDNTVKFLKMLESSPSLEMLRAMNGMVMGDNRSALVSSYSERVFSRDAYLREKSLFEKKIASARDYQAAESAFKKADAQYAATRDTIAFKVRRDLLEGKRAQQGREIELKGAEGRLYVLGLTSVEIRQLERLAQGQTSSTREATQCNDPNCKECAKRKSKSPHLVNVGLRGDDERLAWYPLRAPFDGTVIQKHLTLGEKHSDDQGAFTIADLSSVWVDIRVYQKDLPYIKKGQSVGILASGSKRSAEGKVRFVGPIVDEKTRTGLARVVLPNPGGQWRPGLFIKATISVSQDDAPVVIPKTALQRIDEESIVFVDGDGGLKSTPITLGRDNATHVEVVSGLTPGQRYVVQGAFELKAKIVTSGLGAHAGHGH